MSSSYVGDGFEQTCDLELDGGIVTPSSPRVRGLVQETDATTVPHGTPFTVVEFGDVSARTGAQLEADSIAAGATAFNRPEDAAWDPSNPNDLYFVTTASFTGHSRLWRLRFVDASQPALGGTADIPEQVGGTASRVGRVARGHPDNDVGPKRGRSDAARGSAQLQAWPQRRSRHRPDRERHRSQHGDDARYRLRVR